MIFKIARLIPIALFTFCVTGFCAETFSRTYNAVRLKSDDATIDTNFFAENSFVFNPNNTKNIKWATASGKVSLIINVKMLDDKFQLKDGSSCQTIQAIDDDGKDMVLQLGNETDWVKLVYPSYTMYFYNFESISSFANPIDSIYGMVIKSLSETERARIVDLNKKSKKQDNIVDDILGYAVSGVKISSIEKGSNSSLSGLKTDDIILEINSKEIYLNNSPRELIADMRKSNRVIALKILRGKKMISIKLIPPGKNNHGI